MEITALISEVEQNLMIKKARQFFNPGSVNYPEFSDDMIKDGVSFSIDSTEDETVISCESFECVIIHKGIIISSENLSAVNKKLFMTIFGIELYDLVNRGF